jgi:hypothetical protein
MASSYAFALECAERGHVKPDPVTELGASYKRVLPGESYKEWQRTFQRAQSDKRQYSISKDQWIGWSASKAECHDMDRAVQLLNQRLRALPSANQSETR